MLTQEEIRDKYFKPLEQNPKSWVHNSKDITIKIAKNRQNVEINLNYDKVKNRFECEWRFYLVKDENSRYIIVRSKNIKR